MITGKRGKPSLSERTVERLMIAHNPTQAAPRVFSNLDGRFGIIESMDVAGKCREISEKVSEAVKSSVAKGGSDPVAGELVQKSYPWLTDASPENIVREAERAATVNDQAVSALIAHLVNHIVIGEGLRGVAAQARSEIVRELDDLPSEFKEFCIALQIEGVTIKPLRRLSRDRLRRIAGIIKDVAGSDGDSLPENSEVSAVRRDTGGIGDLSQVGLDDDCPVMPVQGGYGENGSSPDASNGVVELPHPVVITQTGEHADPVEVVIAPGSDEMADLAASYGYRVYEREALWEIDRAVLSRPAGPGVSGYREMGISYRHRVETKRAAEGGDPDALEKIFMERWTLDGEPFASDREVARQWSWEVMVLGKISPPELVPEGWWHGLVMRSPHPSGKRVRVVRQT